MAARWRVLLFFRNHLALESASSTLLRLTSFMITNNYCPDVAVCFGMKIFRDQLIRDIWMNLRNLLYYFPMSCLFVSEIVAPIRQASAILNRWYSIRKSHLCFISTFVFTREEVRTTDVLQPATNFRLKQSAPLQLPIESRSSSSPRCLSFRKKLIRMVAITAILFIRLIARVPLIITKIL